MNTIRKNLEAVIRKGYQPHKVYEDWIGLMFHAFQRDDAHYLEIMRQYRNDAPHGQREAASTATGTRQAFTIEPFQHVALKAKPTGRPGGVAGA